MCDSENSQSLVTHAPMQVATSDIVDAVDAGSGVTPLLLVDVRTEEEWAVSAMPGALHLPVQEDPGSTMGWWVARDEGRSQALPCSSHHHHASDGCWDADKCYWSGWMCACVSCFHTTHALFRCAAKLCCAAQGTR